MNARNSLKSQAVSSDSESEVEPFITQTKAASVGVLQLSFGKTILNLHLRVQTTVKQLTISIIVPTMLQPTCMFTDKEDSGRVITTKKFSRGMKQEYHKTQRGQLHDNFGLSFWLWKSMNQQLRISVNVAQKRRSSL